MIVERFWRLTFLPSLRLLVASHLAFKICFLAPCLWWESENTHVYFWTSLFSMAPNFPIILPNWAICAWRLTAICFTAPIVTSLHSACAAYAGLIVLQFLVLSAVVGAALFPFLISALKQPMPRWWKRIIALSVSCSAFLRICFISLLKSSPYIVGFLGKFPCLCTFLQIWLQFRPWLILSSADRPWLRFWFCVDGLSWRRFWYCSVLGSLVPLWGRLSRLWCFSLGCLGFLGTWYGGICSLSSDLLSRSSSTGPV